MDYQFPPLKALRAFESAARTGSYVDAANELNVTPAAVSQQVRNLETYFSRQLFTRYNNRIVLTDAGTRIYSDLGPPLLDLAQKNRQLLEGPTSAKLVISVLPSLAQTWLVPRLTRFAQQNAHIGIHTRVEEDPVDLVKSNIDLRLTYGSQLYADYASQRIFQDAVLPMCSPAFAEQLQLTDTNLAQLPDHQFLHIAWGDRFASHPTWGEWFRRQNIERDPVIANGHQVSMSSVGLEYAAAGLGIILGQQSFAERYLREGRLISLGDDPLPLGQAYFAIHAHAALQLGVIERLLDELTD